MPQINCKQPPVAKPLILLIGGTSRPTSVTERALRLTGDLVVAKGANVEIIAGDQLDLPMYAPENPARSERALKLVDAFRRCDGLIIAGYGYHGALSGMLKNALDYTEDMAKDERPYLHDRVVGLIGTATTWQDVGTVLISIRSVVHALRGWPTPLGVAINTTAGGFDEEKRCNAPEVLRQLELLASQVVEFTTQWPKRSLALRKAHETTLNGELT